jgi:hypothetical protein
VFYLARFVANESPKIPSPPKNNNTKKRCLPPKRGSSPKDASQKEATLKKAPFRKSSESNIKISTIY